MSRKKAVVIGAGFSGLAASTVLADAGWDVTVLEKNATVGGRARVLKKDGFTFDMGPSWYWMPQVMEDYFYRFGKSTADFFELERLDPSYRVVFGPQNEMDLPANFEALKVLFEEREKGAGEQLELFLAEAKKKYDISMRDFVNKPSLSLTEYMKVSMLKSALTMDLFQSFSKHVRRYFKSEELLQVLDFPILFLGAIPRNIPALYSLMNYADLKLGTWYPMGGMSQLANAMHMMAESKGVRILCDSPVSEFRFEGKSINTVVAGDQTFDADLVISSADYHFTDQQLLPPQFRNYSGKYWKKRTMAPSCLLFYIGLNKKVERLKHHNLFFEESFDAHAATIYETVEYPKKPLYYVCCPSKTDASVAPEGGENLFLLIPIAPGLKDSPEIRTDYFDELMERLERYCGEPIRRHVVSYTDYSVDNFIGDYNAFKGNAYGLANTLRQTAIFKPRMKNKKLKNLYYAGQLTVPGPGVPPALISGQLVADYVLKHHNDKTRTP